MENPLPGVAASEGPIVDSASPERLGVCCAVDHGDGKQPGGVGIELRRPKNRCLNPKPVANRRDKRMVDFAEKLAFGLFE